jgi:hypothetical protein
MSVSHISRREMDGLEGLPLGDASQKLAGGVRMPGAAPD